MAVVAVRKRYQGQTASKDAGGKRFFVAYFQVETDDPQDGENVVLGAAAVALGIPLIGQGYSFGNDAYPSATCNSLRPEREDGTRVSWIVEATFETPDNNAGSSGPRPGADGEPSDDPEDWREEFEIDSAFFAYAVEVAILRTSFSGGRAAGTVGAVTNAANVAFDPPPEDDYACDVLRITKYRLDYPSEHASTYKNAINFDEVSITKPGYGRTFDPYTLKLLPIRGSLNYHQTAAGVIVPYWKLLYELHEKKIVLDSVTLTWRLQVLNRGYSARAQPGDDNGFGGTLSAGDIPAGQPRLRALQDVNGDPLNEPPLLDLSGAPLTSGNGVYITYSTRPELNFSDLNL